MSTTTDALSLTAAQLRQRLCIFHDSAYTIETIVRLAEADVTFQTMLDAGVQFVNLRASRVAIDDLKKRGFDSISCYRQLGMDAIDLTDTPWTRALVDVYGVKAVRDEYAQTADEVATLVGTETGHVLHLSVVDALDACIGEPNCAYTVLSAQTDVKAALRLTTVEQLLDAGVRAQGLSRIGVTLEALSETLSPSAQQLRKLGYGVSTI
jgi:hypothetical protein